MHTVQIVHEGASIARAIPWTAWSSVSSGCVWPHLPDTPHSRDKWSLAQLVHTTAAGTREYSSTVLLPPSHGQTRVLVCEIRTQLRVRVDTAPQQPSSRTHFLVRQRKHHLTFASYFQDRDILTSVIFQGCFVFPMVLLRQLGKKPHSIFMQNKHHETRCCLSPFSLQSMGNQCANREAQPSWQATESAVLFLWLQRTFGISSSQTPFSRSGMVSVS